MDLHLPPSADHRLKNLALKADRMVVGVLLLGAVAAVILGAINGPMSSGSALAGALFCVGVIAWRIAPGTLFSRLTLAVVGMLMVSLHIQLAMGLTELHFGVFVFLAFLLVYRDWRPIVAAAATIAVHHILFDRLQAFGWPVFCLTEPNFGRVLIHAAFVVIQTGVEIIMAVRMRSDALEAQELHSLCRPSKDGDLNLDVGSITVQSASAKAVHDAFLKLNRVVTEARETAEVVQQSSAYIASSNQNLEMHSQRTSSQLQETAQRVQHIQQDANTSATESAAARQFAAQATTDAHTCGELVSQVVHTMSAINDSSRKIGDIVGLIDSIAFQTNILALNAAVEAARAGEHGKGFAVVATEVRSLAQRSASAAKDVRALIQTSLEHATQGADLANTAGASMQSVVGHTNRMAQVIDTLSQLAQTQSQSLEQAASALHDLEGMTQENSALVAQSAHAATQLLVQATKLQNVVVGVRSSQSKVASPPHSPSTVLATAPQSVLTPTLMQAPA